MSGEMRFLIVEDDEDGGFLIERALRRKFAGAEIQMVRDGDAARAAAATGTWRGFIVHRSLDVDGLEVVRRLRAINRTIPIVFISGRDQSTTAVAAGATQFVRYSDWQTLGVVFEGVAE
ncbi:MAG TPA: response regulator [Opitutaceae bacterium]|nr:response regulator [Opitutaceae bacterium]